MKSILRLGLVFLIALLPLSCGKQGSTKQTTIAVIPKGTTHEFWKSIHAGAVKASRELNVDIIWKGPLREDDRDQQISVVEDFISRGVAGMVLAPLDDIALRAPVANATSAGIPVVIIDSGLKSEDYTSFVATDNFKGGEMAGQPIEAMTLIGLGFRSLSMPPGAIGAIRHMMQKLDAGRLKERLAGLIASSDHTVRDALIAFAAAEGVAV